MPGRSRCPAAKIKKLKCALLSAEPHLRTLGRSFSLAVSAVRQSLRRIRKGCFLSQLVVVATPSALRTSRYPVCCRKRVMARRRSPPRRGGSSDAARTLVPRERGTAGGRRPYDARQGGEQGTDEGRRSPVRDGCPKAGLGIVGGKGPPRPLIPCRPPRRRPSPDAGQKPLPSGKSKKEDAPSLLYANGSRQQRLEFPAEAQTGVDGGGIRAEKLASRLDLGKEVAGVMQAQTALKEQGVTPRKFSG